MSNKKYILILITVIIVFIISIGINYIFLGKISAMKSEADSSSTEIISKAKLAEYYKNIKNLSVVSAEQRAELDSILVDYNDAVKFIEQIEKTADEVGVKLEIANLADDKKKEDTTPLPLIGKLDFSVSITGSWERVSRFVMALESLPYKITINDVQFNKTGSEVATSKNPSSWKAGINFSVLTRNK